MLRQSSSRNQRSKGFKIKHVLQICVLLAICFWLIYQIKHTYDKRKEFIKRENIAKKLESDKTSVEILKLGRKDLHPQKEENVIDIEQHEEEEEDQEHDEEQEQEHEDEITNDDKEDEERDELDALYQEKSTDEDDEVTHDHTDFKLISGNKILVNITEKIVNQVAENITQLNRVNIVKLRGVPVKYSTIFEEFTYQPGLNMNSTQAENSTVLGKIIGDESHHKFEPLNTIITENVESSEATETTYDGKSINVQNDDSILEEEKENRIDLDTLPDLKTEWTENEDLAAE